MGQKVNPNIFRLGNIKQWKSKYIEKKPSEYGIYTFQDLEIQQFIKKLLYDNNLILHTFQSRYFENSLHIYLSYYVKKEIFTLIKNQQIGNDLKFKLKSEKLTKQFRRKYFNLKQKTNNYLKYTKTVQNFKNKSLTKQYNKNNLSKKIQHIKMKDDFLFNKKCTKFISYFRLGITAKHNRHSKTLKNIQTYFFWNKIAKTIQLFIGNFMNLTLHFNQLSVPINLKFTNKQIKMLKKIIGQLRRYKNSHFFKEGVNLIFLFLITNQSANLLAIFIAAELKKYKRHNFFLNFIKTTLRLLNQNPITEPKRIKIKIKGRFNGSSRARYKIINIRKNVPNSTVQANINHSETTAFTQNGTFGIKIWTLE